MPPARIQAPAPTSNVGCGTQRAEATGSLGIGLGSMHSTSWAMRRKRLPRSTTVALMPKPVFEVKTRRAVGCLRMPMPRKWTSSLGLSTAIIGQISSMWLCRQELRSPAKLRV